MNTAVNNPAGVARAAGRRGSAGFSMIEILLAAMVLSVGFIMLLPAFVAGINESRLSIEASTVVQLGQNADGYLHGAGVSFIPGGTGSLSSAGQSRYLDPYNDTSLVADGAIHPYTFGANAYSIPNDALIRVLGDAGMSKYYWSLLYRFPTKNPSGAYSKSVVECWIMVCKREQTGVDAQNHPLYVNNPTSVSSTDSRYVQANTGIVTDQGEILRVAYNDGTVHLLEPTLNGYSSVWVVPAADSAHAGNPNDYNGCIGVLHTWVGN